MAGVNASSFKKLLLSLCLCFLWGLSQLQGQHHAQWLLAPFPQGVNTSAASVGDGTFIVAGSYEAWPDRELFVFRVDACGNLLWSKKWNSPNAAYGRINNVKIFGQEVFVFGCLNPLFPDTAGVITVLNLQGQHLWSKKYYTDNWEFWFNLDINNRGEIFLAGHNNSSTFHDNHVVKLNHKGEVIWSNSYTQSSKWGRGTATSDGGFLKVTGSTIFKLKGNGEPEWIYDYDNLQWTGIMPQEVDDGYYIVSELKGSPLFNFKINRQGQVIWVSKGLGYTYARDVAVDDQQNLLLLGNYISYGSSCHLYQFNQASTNFSGSILERSLAPALAYFQGHSYIFLRGSGLNRAGIDMIKLPAARPDTGNCLPMAYDTSHHRLASTKRNASIYNATPLPYPLTIETLEVNLTDIVDTSLFQCENLNAIPDSLDLGPDTAFCPGGSVKLAAKNLVLGDYLWSTGAKTPTVKVKTPGVYWLEVNAGCGQKILRDSIYVGEYPLSKIKFTLEGEASVLDSATFGLKPDSLRADWFVDDTLQKYGRNLNWRFAIPGAHEIKACYTTPRQCQQCDSLRVLVPEEKLHLPTAFTPNGDGLNDFFGPDESAVHSYQLTLLSRNGKQLATLQNQAWNGQRKGKTMPQGIYIYRLTYRFFKDDRERILNGHVMLLP